MLVAVILRKSLLCSTILAAVACSGGGGGGGPMGTPIGDIRGNYAVTHTLSLGLGSISCPGALSVTNQTGTDFSGTISISDVEGCEGVASQGTISGTVTSQGVLMFTVTLPIIDVLLDLSGCEIVGGSTTFSGTATSAGLSAARVNQLECPDGSGGQIAYTIAGQKT